MFNRCENWYSSLHPSACDSIPGGQGQTPLFTERLCSISFPTGMCKAWSIWLRSSMSIPPIKQKHLTVASCGAPRVKVTRKRRWLYRSVDQHLHTIPIYLWVLVCQFQNCVGGISTSSLSHLNVLYLNPTGKKTRFRSKFAPGLLVGDLSVPCVYTLILLPIFRVLVILQREGIGLFIG